MGEIEVARRHGFDASVIPAIGQGGAECPSDDMADVDAASRQIDASSAGKIAKVDYTVLRRHALAGEVQLGGPIPGAAENAKCRVALRCPEDRPQHQLPI